MMLLVHGEHAGGERQRRDDHLPWMRSAELAVCPEDARRHYNQRPYNAATKNISVKQTGSECACEYLQEYIITGDLRAI